ncbi:hypothetical protein KIN20_020366 [Parelaphostrongylus tenuis]|uniref:Uncharacterized protein n=1 Tax=Parelaphostrongylus tenuis TaxID=148309 RepID=A0AAD5MSS3_PARTN|nr:hypothetical protein KIN20_020366 [Parelaphostrongylus tenuis]
MGTQRASALLCCKGILQCINPGAETERDIVRLKPEADLLVQSKASKSIISRIDVTKPSFTMIMIYFDVLTNNQQSPSSSESSNLETNQNVEDYQAPPE